MIYAQVEPVQKLHLAYEPGEGRSAKNLIPVNHLSAPICGRGFGGRGGYRMTINMSLGEACRNCLRVHKARIK